MAQPADTFSSYDAVGNREDLSDVIYDISPTDTPFLSGVGRNSATGVLHEWQTDALATAGANAVIEGDDATTDASTATVRLSNSCQISDKVPRITGTQEAVHKAGRRSEMNYQVAKMAAELKRDMEFTLLANNAEVTGNDTTARELGSVLAWIDTNSDFGTGGGDGSLGNTARTDGTQRAFAEGQLKTVLQSVWSEGGDPDCIMVGAFNKTQLSTFTGNATRYVEAEHGKLHAAIDVYISDWSPEGLQVIPNRFMRARDCLVVQKDMWAVSYLRPFAIYDLAKTGDTERKQLLAEYTLESRNEKASGIVADLTTS